MLRFDEATGSATAAAIELPLVMVVDDEEPNLEFLQRALSPAYDVRGFSSPHAALDALREDSYAVIISDQQMPGMTGVEFLTEAATCAPDAARILFTGHANLRTALDAVNCSRVHAILTKPVDVMALTAEVDRCAAYRRLIIENRTLTYDLARSNQELLTARRLLETDLDARSHELLAANRRLEQLANRDGLTGLYNHRYFHERCEQEVSAALRHGHATSLIFCDLDSFKVYNDRCGHPAGDELLRTVGRILLENTREEDVVARYGGEEFVILLPHTPNPGAVVAAERLRLSVAHRDFSGMEMLPTGRVTASFGVASCPQDGRSRKDLVQCADHAVYQAKSGGRNRVVRGGSQGEGVSSAVEVPAAGPFSACGDLSPERRLELRDRALARERGLREEAERLLEDRTRELFLANEQLKEQHAFMIQTEKMSALGRMSAGVAHEINNALNFMKGNSQLLPRYIGVYQDLLLAYRAAASSLSAEALARLQALEQAKRVAFIEQDLPKLLSAIGTGLERATTIVRDLGTFSRSDEVAEMQEVDLRQPMEIALTLGANRLKRKVQVVREFGEEGLRVFCHPGKISQVYLNLLLNAADAIPDKGEVRISFRGEPERAVTVIADTGCGMTREQQARLFEPFFTTKAPGEGTGLGLFMSRKIVDEHGGELRCESEPGRGTVFELSLPLRRKE